jgi:hypothetical protein
MFESGSNLGGIMDERIPRARPMINGSNKKTHKTNHFGESFG